MDAPLCALCWVIDDETKQASFVINGHSVCVTHLRDAKYSNDFDEVYDIAKTNAHQERLARREGS